MKPVRTLAKRSYSFFLRKMLIPFEKKHLSNSLSIFNYHQISPFFDPRYHTKGTWTELNHFREQILYIKNKFIVISLEEGIQRLEENSLNSKYAAITIDDGDISLKKFSIPFLNEANIKATLFINSAYLQKGVAGWGVIFNYLYNSKSLNHLLNDEILEAGYKLRKTDDKNYYQNFTQEIIALKKYLPEGEEFYIDSDFLDSLDPALFHIGLHGHEHHRFSMLKRQTKIDDLNENLVILSQFKAFRKYFALPFGRSYDYDFETISIATTLGLRTFLHEGGINFANSFLYKRIPSDGKKLKDEISNNLLI